MREELALAQAFAGNSRAASTERAYRRDWATFTAWCAKRSLESLPAAPEVVAIYLAAFAGTLKAATLERRLAAIAAFHRQSGFTLNTRHPLLVEVWRGIRRTIGTQKHGKVPIHPDELRAMVTTLPETLSGWRDRALLLLGYAAALRRSELVALNIDDLSFSADGLIIELKRGKHDQEGQGEFRAIPRGELPQTCPVKAVRHWLITAHLGKGPLFRAIDRFGRLGESRLSDKAVALIIKRSAQAMAVATGRSVKDAARWADQLAGHSLRAGFATAAAQAGCDEWEIMRQTGHKRRETVQRYIRIGTLFSDNAAAKIGL